MENLTIQANRRQDKMINQQPTDNFYGSGNQMQNDMILGGPQQFSQEMPQEMMD